MPNIQQTVQSIYAAFGQGDVATILAALAEDVAWESWADNRAQQASVPWLRGGSGKQAVLDFLGVVGAQMTMNDFRVLSLLANDKQVAVEVLIDATLANGRRLRDEELHLWTFDGQGKVVRMRHYVDTAKHIAAAAA